MKRIVFFHLYNDFSGSPKVLSLVIRNMVEKGYDVELFTSKTDGFLSDLKGVTYHKYTYSWSKNKFRTILFLLYAQIFLFISSFRYIFSRDTVFYINTICPIGAVLGGWLCRIKTIYHIQLNQ